MLESENEEVEKVASMQICIASLNNENAKPLALECINGSENRQIAAAEIFAAKMKESKHSEICKQALKKYFYSTNSEVQEKSTGCFKLADYDDICTYIDIISIFIESPAFIKGAEDIIFAFDNSNSKLPEIAIDVCKKFLDIAGKESASISNNAALISYDISKVVIKLYNQNISEEIKSKCLDLIDYMIQLRAMGITDVINEYDRK